MRSHATAAIVTTPTSTSTLLTILIRLLPAERRKAKPVPGSHRAIHAGKAHFTPTALALGFARLSQTAPGKQRYAARKMMSRSVLSLSLLTLFGCQLPSENPPEAPREKPAFVEAGALPPEETAPPEAEPAPAPSAQPVEPGVAATGAPTRGRLPKAVIDEKLKSVGPAVQACYEQGLKGKPDLRGVVNVNFVVGEDGKVVHADAAEGDDALPDAATASCILGAIKKLEFPAPSGGRVFISYPLKLEPPKPAAP
jgi:hypothetical protein